MLDPDAEWPFVKQHLAGIKFYIGQLYGPRGESPDVTMERLRKYAQLVKAYDLQVAVELGGCLDFSPLDDTAGEWSARRELSALDKFYAAGGKVDFLDLDGPVRRLLHPHNRRDGRKFDSIEKAADELVDSLQIHRRAHPETRYWLLTNFPNWGYRGDVSYHARGPELQDYGDYDQVVRIVLDKLKAAGIELDGVTVDNPYEYLIGEFRSVKIADPKTVDWLGRVRSYEDFARERGLKFNLIVNSQRGGKTSDELFHRETLQMVDAFLAAGGRPDRWFVQSWYPFPKQIVPESAPHSMTALVKAVIQRTRPENPGADASRAPSALESGDSSGSDVEPRPAAGAAGSLARGVFAKNNLTTRGATTPEVPPQPPHGLMEEMTPDELEEVLDKSPVAFVPLGTYEHHGWHLPVCFDGIKAHALCQRVSQRTGGAVLPTFFYGTGGGHVGYKWTLILPEETISPLIEATLDHLAKQGFKVVVLLTGHYAREQVSMVHRLAKEAQKRHPQVRFIGLTEPEITTPAPGDTRSGDHAAKYETSIALALNPKWVGIDRLTSGRDAVAVTLPDTPKKDAPTHDPDHPLYAIHGQDPRTEASAELGKKIVDEIVTRLATQVAEGLSEASAAEPQ
ncbi:MAG: creatininase family protein [Planctomycetota bacterium]